jgi:uncharacterized protein (TIGR02996 family)
MNDVALLAAILDSPDDDLPRLAYADWLEEHGDLERAGFIRLQLDLAKWPAWDPRYQRVVTLDPARTLGSDRSEDLPPLQPDQLSWAQFPWWRGFPERVWGTIDAFLEHAEELFALAPVRAFSGIASPESITRLARSLWLARLRSLVLDSGALGAAPLRELGESPHALNLSHLALTNFGATGEGLEALVATPLFAQLVELDLSHAYTIAAGARLGVAALRLGRTYRLEKLTLSRTNCGRDDLSAILDSPLPANLTTLRIDLNSIGPGGWQRLTRCPFLSRLQVLSAETTELGQRAVPALLEAPWVSGLRWLNLGSAVDAAQMRRLASAERLAQLTVLELPFSKIGPSGAEALSESSLFTNLVRLNLRYNDLSEAAVLRLVDSPHLANLFLLDVTGNTISQKTRRNLRRRRNRLIQV